MTEEEKKIADILIENKSYRKNNGHGTCKLFLEKGDCGGYGECEICVHYGEYKAKQLIAAGIRDISVAGTQNDLWRYKFQVIFEDYCKMWRKLNHISKMSKTFNKEITEAALKMMSENSYEIDLNKVQTKENFTISELYKMGKRVVHGDGEQ